jgi:peptidoglycan/LPS O-acetylase OafA/YrhL
MVFLVHCYALSQSSFLKPLATFLSSSLAVKSFFAVSGFLIFMSYEKNAHLGTYFAKRVKRIYPAYFVVVMLCALLGCFFTQYQLAQYFSIAWLKYVLANLLFLNFIQPDLPGVFVSNPLIAVNGALWTLKIEVMFYLCVPLFVWLMRKFGRWQILLTLYLASVCYRMGIEAWGIAHHSPIYKELVRQLPGQLVYFVSGATFYYYLPYLKTYWRRIVVIAIVIMLMDDVTTLAWLEPLALAALVVSAAYVMPFLGNFGKNGDLSYGIYIVHFPILQGLIQLGLFEISPMFGFVIAAVLVLGAAYASWHLVEKPFLAKKFHYSLVNA